MCPLSFRNRWSHILGIVWRTHTLLRLNSNSTLTGSIISSKLLNLCQLWFSTCKMRIIVYTLEVVRINTGVYKWYELHIILAHNRCSVSGEIKFSSLPGLHLISSPPLQNTPVLADWSEHEPLKHQVHLAPML